METGEFYLADQAYVPSFMGTSRVRSAGHMMLAHAISRLSNGSSGAFTSTNHYLYRC